MSVAVDIKRGSIHLAADVCDTYFKNIASVIVIHRDDQFMVMPVQHMASGGSLLKVKNLAGDRVAHAADVFAAHGLADIEQKAVPARWSSQHGALLLEIRDSST